MSWVLCRGDQHPAVWRSLHGQIAAPPAPRTKPHRSDAPTAATGRRCPTRFPGAPCSAAPSVQIDRTGVRTPLGGGGGWSPPRARRWAGAAREKLFWRVMSLRLLRTVRHLRRHWTLSVASGESMERCRSASSFGIHLWPSNRPQNPGFEGFLRILRVHLLANPHVFAPMQPLRLLVRL